MTPEPARPGKTVARAAAWAAIVYSLLLAAPLLWGSFDDGADSAVGGVIAATWSASPVYGAALFAHASATRGGAVLFLTIELLIMAWFGWMWVEVSILHPSSTGGLIYFTLPLLQWGVLVLASALAALCGWRARENWPDPPTG